jgi:hypothetical protein
MNIIFLLHKKNEGQSGEGSDGAARVDLLTMYFNELTIVFCAFLICFLSPILKHHEINLMMLRIMTDSI